MKKKFLWIGLIVIGLIFTPNVYAKEIKTGTYKIVSALDKDKILVEKEGNIELGNEQSEGIKTWDISSDGGYYYIKSHDDNHMTLDVSGAIAKNGSNVQLYEENKTIAQKWRLVFADSTSYYITSALGNYNMDAAGGSKALGTNMQIYKGNGTNAQKWQLVRQDEPQKTIEEGSYIIKNKANPNNALDLFLASTSNCTNIDVYSANNTWAQIWNISYSEDGYYTIATQMNDKKVIDVFGGAFGNLSNVQLYQSNGTNAQKWLINQNEDGSYSFYSYDGIWAIDILCGSTASGANIQLYQPNDTPAQKYSLEKVNVEPIENGYYTINSALDDTKVVGVNNEALYNGKNIELRTANDHNYTKWHIKRIKNDIYTITSAENKNKVIDVSGNGKANGTNIQVYESNNSDAQKWIIRKNEDNTYKIIGVASNKSMDIATGSSNEGTNIQLYEWNGTNAQKFILTPTEVVPYTQEYEAGNYIIQSNLNTNKVVDVSAASRSNGTNIQLYSENGTKAQFWKLDYLGDGQYVFRSLLHTGLVLTANGTNVELNKYTGADSQRWYLNKKGNITIMINKANGQYVNVTDGKTNDSTNISLSNTTKDSNQFVFSKYTNEIKYKGIDVSYHQKTIDWGAVNGQIDFAIIRAGYSDEVIQEDGTDKYQDKTFIENVKKCEEYNIPYALYFYSYANKLNDGDNPSYNIGPGSSGDSESVHMIKLINKIRQLGYNPNLKIPIYFDQEEPDVYNKISSVNSGEGTKRLLTDIANRFCGNMNNNGYQCGIYSNKNWLNNNLDISSIAKNHAIWVAQWPEPFMRFPDEGLSRTTSYTTTPYKVWQFSSSGSINGISGNVDLDIGYNIFD